MSKINYYFNDLYDECIARFNNSYMTMLDTMDYVPLDHIEEQQKELFRRQKKTLRRISREERRFRRRLGREQLRYYERLAEQCYIDGVLQYYADEKGIIIESEAVPLSDVPEDSTTEVIVVQAESTNEAQPGEDVDVLAEGLKGEDSDVRA